MSAVRDAVAAPAQALAALIDTLGAAQVLADADSLHAYAHSTAARPTMPLAVVLPDTAAQVAQIVRIAAAHGLAVYPISTGKNWGYGDACAVGAGQLVIDMRRMNRIVSINADLAYAVIEPGVTQQQLSAHLAAHGLPLWMDCTGAGPDTSLMGNILERGFGHSPYGNRLQHTAGMQVVLASGELVETGFGHYQGAHCTHLFPYGVGPLLDGLFTQSNLGIVTQIGIWLMPQTACVHHFLCSVQAHEAIGAVVDALRPLRLDGTLRSIVHIGNDLRALSGGRVFPRGAEGGDAMLPDAVRAQWRRETGLGAWTVSGALYGSRAQVAAAEQALRRALRPTAARLTVVTDARLRLGAALARVLGNSAAGQRLRGKLAFAEALMAMNRGVPNGRFLAGAYWRRRGGLPARFPASANPAADGCGLMWVAPIVPLRGADLLRVHGLVEAIFRRYRFDLFATFSMVNERSLGAVFTIAYDKEDAQETLRAKCCYNDVFECVMQAGYPPYRVGLGAMGRLDPQGDSYWRTIARIKDALDPAGTLAPGRYAPHEARRLWRDR